MIVPVKTLSDLIFGKIASLSLQLHKLLLEIFRIFHKKVFGALHDGYFSYFFKNLKQ